MEEKEKEALYIPQGIKFKSEIFEGYGKAELFQSIIGILVISVIDAVIFIITKRVILTMIIILTGIAGSVMFVTKDKNNLSVVDQLKNMFNFYRAQKSYPYVALDEWDYLNKGNRRKV